ncbi:MAG: hypothetical protein MI745_09410 [Pseudomonadales bacterium]|nr:hypothetical protein [Pseudomonadales bacterium]
MDTGKKALQKKKLSAQAVASLTHGVAKLVEGQKQFAEEMGLPYSRIFHDGYEAFKDKTAREVIFSWLYAGADGHEKIEALFVDLLEHQLALVEALASIQNPSIPASSPIDRLIQSLFGSEKTDRENSHRSYMQDTAPAFIAAYARAREQGSFDRPLLESRSS